ncbi:MAG TPA: AAA family ATPase [Chromatiaceae bacterium]|nr:AAA family ATPase [Chromatiaceae bacterium]
MKLQDFPLGQTLKLEARGSWPEAYHYFEPDHMKAVVAAWHAGRPLLIRGKPGVGKSQLARAVAECRKMQFISVVVQPRTEYQDLLWQYDAVARLADAQILAAMQDPAIQKKLALKHYVAPGPLWWALNPKTARKRNQRQDGAGKSPDPRLMPEEYAKNGNVVLIDEIDKADIDLPNGLLELLGNQSFTTPHGEIVASGSADKPLIIVTTNEDRELPPAFVRRCLVLRIALPKNDDETAFTAAMRKYAHAHFKDRLDESLFIEAAELLRKERIAAEAAHQPPPGPAEYLDLLRVVDRLAGGDKQAQRDLLEEMRPFVLGKAGSALDESDL